jgi:hypothetical protein
MVEEAMIKDVGHKKALIPYKRIITLVFVFVFALLQTE